MSDNRDIGYCVFGFGFGIWSFSLGFNRLRRKRLIENIPTIVLGVVRTACLQAKTVGESSKAEGALGGALKTLFAVSENYPDLKASQNFTQLQQRISYLESQIADRRELYNDSGNNYNIRINQIPDMFVAQMLQMKPKELFKALEEERKDVDIRFELPK